MALEPVPNLPSIPQMSEIQVSDIEITPEITAARDELEQKQLRFVEEYLAGTTPQESYLIAYGEGKTPSSVLSAPYRMLKNPRVMRYIALIRDEIYRPQAMSKEEKRYRLARISRQDLSDAFLEDGGVNPAIGDVVQEITVSRSPDGSESVKVKLPSRLSAIDIDNRMAGDYQPVKSEMDIRALIANIPNPLDLQGDSTGINQPSGENVD